MVIFLNIIYYRRWGRVISHCTSVHHVVFIETLEDAFSSTPVSSERRACGSTETLFVYNIYIYIIYYTYIAIRS